MAYQSYYPNGWKSGEVGGTPITPAALNNMEAGIEDAHAIGDGLNLYFGPNADSWSAIYSILSAIPINRSAFFLSVGAVTRILSNNGVANVALKGIINSTGSGVYDIIAYTGFMPNKIWIWRISGFTSASATPTVGTVAEYESTVTMAKSINLTAATWSEMYAMLSLATVSRPACISFSGTTASVLTGGVVTYACTGVVKQVINGTFEFMVMSNESQRIYTWRITGFTSASVTPTVGNISIYDPVPSPATCIVLSSADTTWEKIFPKLTQITTSRTATIFINANGASVISNGKISNALYGTVCRQATDVFTFMASPLATNVSVIYTWRITGVSASGATFGNVYSYTGTVV